MYYGNIKYFDIANGIGVRTSLFVSGCHHHCKGCFQPETWNPTYGNEYTIEVSDKIIKSLKPDYIKGLSLLGGDPYYHCNILPLFDLVKRVRTEYGDKKDIWCYTGSLFEDLLPDGIEYSEEGYLMLKSIDVLVDGPFIEEKRDLTLAFRGSSNQRIIDLKKSFKENKTVLLDI